MRVFRFHSILFLGWPILQIQMLQELVIAAKRMGHSALATRHMTFLLQTMWPHLSQNDQRELAIQLQVCLIAFLIKSFQDLYNINYQHSDYQNNYLLYQNLYGITVAIVPK